MNIAASTLLTLGLDETVIAAVVDPDGSPRQVVLSGDDAERFATIRTLINAKSVTALVISQQDGPAAVAWIDEFGDRKGLRTNEVLSALLNRRVQGAVVLAGPGPGDGYSMSSVDAGLLAQLDNLSKARG